ncbi:tetratricopeptide repeat protein [Edaphobacter sp. DSM 109919]|uniref:Tetratricopeptide repeat protein n=1 Tax=Edaphobacter paludis TaxID=3035702 RepID=A0AAU7CW26_9BACT
MQSLFPIILALAISPGSLAGQNAASRPTTNSVIDSHLAAAQEAQHSQDYSTAEREYKAVLAVVPDFAQVHLNLGLIYQLENRTPEAMTEFHRALKIKPGLAAANLMLGVDYCKMGEGTRAIPYLTAAVNQDPTRPESWSWLAAAHEMSGDVKAELVTVKHALKLQPQNVDLLYLLGHTYEQLGKAEVERMQAADPGSFRAEQLLAEGYATSSEWPSAVIHFQNALAASPNQPGLHVELGEVLLRAGKLERAGREFNEELQINPHSVRAIVRRGEAKLLEGDLDGSLQDWSQAIEIDPLYAARVLGIGDAESGDSAFEQLPAESLQKIEQLVPELQNRNSAAAQFALAYLAAQRGQVLPATGDPAHTNPPLATCSESEARRALNSGRLSSLAPCGSRVLTATSSEDFRIQMAAALFELGDYETSMKMLDGLPAGGRHLSEVAYWRARCYEKLATAAYLKLYQADPNSYRLHQLMGDLAATRGDDKKAIEEYRASLALKPSAPGLHYSLGHLLWKNLDVSGARVELEAELAINPRHVEALHDLGDTYLLERQPEKALTYLNRAFTAGGDTSDIHRDLGTAYADLGNNSKAEAEFNIALPGDHDGSVHFKLGRVYQALGEKEKAAHEFAISANLNRESHTKLEKQTPRLTEIEK